MTKSHCFLPQTSNRFFFQGIKALPLDSSHYHWQASITGPVGSPYEGGIFFLYLKVPFQYPFDPPEVRFLTRIFHPNVSRHGDVGMDSISHHNWVSGALSFINVKIPRTKLICCSSRSVSGQSFSLYHVSTKHFTLFQA